MSQQPAEDAWTTGHAGRLDLAWLDAASVAAALRDGLVLLSTDGEILDVSPRFCAMVGLTREELVGARPPFRFWSAQDRDSLDAALHEALHPPAPDGDVRFWPAPHVGQAAGSAGAWPRDLELTFWPEGDRTRLRETLRAPSHDNEFTFVRSNGKRFPVIVSTSLLRDPARNPAGFLQVVKDATSLKLARTRLRERSEQLRAVFDASPIAIVTLDPDGIVKSWNSAADRIFGWSEAEVVGRPAPWVPSTAQREAEGFRERVLRGDSLPGVEARLVRKDGSPVDVSISIARLRGPDGTATGVMAVIADVTDRKRAERERDARALHQSALAELRSLVLTVRDPASLPGDAVRIAVHTLDVEFAEVLERVPGTEALRRVAGEGWPPAPARGVERAAQPGTPAFSALASDEPVVLGDLTGQARPDADAELVALGIQSGLMVAIKAEVPARAVLGVYTRERRGFTPVEVAFLQAVSNILATAAQRATAEAQLRFQAELLDHLEAAVIATDLDGVITHWNRRAEAFYGWTPDEVTGRTILDVLFPDLDAKGSAALMGRIRAGETWESEEVARRRDGGRVTAWVNRAPVRNRKGRAIGHVGVLVDMTERKRAEQEIVHAQKLEALGILAGGIAHDFNNLLTAIAGNVSLALMDVPPSSPARESLDQIDLATRRATDLARQLLAYTGRGRFAVQLVDVGDLVRGMSELLKVSVSKGIELRSELPPELPLVEADLAQIRQAVVNLVVNASDAIGYVGGTISLACTSKHVSQWRGKQNTWPHSDVAPGDYVVIEVRDTGAGMAPATIERAFDPFYTTKAQGRGLGLAATLGIVRAHRGVIEAESRLGRGSTFRIFLPVAPEPLEEADAGSLDEASGDGLHGTVLVIDDEPGVRSVAARVLESQGCQVLVAPDGPSGIELFRTSTDRIDAVLLDMTMPYLDGVETFRELRRVRSDARVVLMSGYDAHGAAESLRVDGLVGFLQKPFKTDDLAHAIRAAMAADTDRAS